MHASHNSLRHYSLVRFAIKKEKDWWVTRNLEKGCDYYFGITDFVSKSQEEGGWAFIGIDTVRYEIE